MLLIKIDLQSEKCHSSPGVGDWGHHTVGAKIRENLDRDIGDLTPKPCNSPKPLLYVDLVGSHFKHRTVSYAYVITDELLTVSCPWTIQYYNHSLWKSLVCHGTERTLSFVRLLAEALRWRFQPVAPEPTVSQNSNSVSSIQSLLSS